MNNRQFKRQSIGAQMRCKICNKYKPDRCICNKPKDLKGIKGGNCNRTECQKPNAVWYNHSTMKYYCEECALMLNEVNKTDAMELFGHDLCSYEAD